MHESNSFGNAKFLDDLMSSTGPTRRQLTSQARPDAVEVGYAIIGAYLVPPQPVRVGAAADISTEGLVINGERAMLAVPLGSPPAQVTHDPHPTPPSLPLSTATDSSSFG